MFRQFLILLLVFNFLISKILLFKNPNLNVFDNYNELLTLLIDF
jgi:hypothetical protein